MLPYDDRREHLLGTAARVFAANGFHSTTMRDLARETGMSLAGMYHYVSGKDELLEEPIDVRELVGSVVRMLHVRADTAGLQLAVELDHALPRLFADPRKIKQVLINIVFNAIKFTPQSGRVTLRAWARRDSGYVVQVIDTGIGIAMEDIPKALSLFGQIDSERARKQNGTGLGLPLSKKLVEMHSGSLDLQSELGVGTTVTVRLPPERVLTEDGNVHE